MKLQYHVRSTRVSVQFTEETLTRVVELVKEGKYSFSGILTMLAERSEELLSEYPWTMELLKSLPDRTDKVFDGDPLEQRKEATRFANSLNEIYVNENVFSIREIHELSAQVGQRKIVEALNYEFSYQFIIVTYEYDGQEFIIGTPYDLFTISDVLNNCEREADIYEEEGYDMGGKKEIVHINRLNKTVTVLPVVAEMLKKKKQVSDDRNNENTGRG